MSLADWGAHADGVNCGKGCRLNTCVIFFNLVLQVAEWVRALAGDRVAKYFFATSSLRVIILTRLPSKQELRWLRTRKPLAYRESTCTNLSVSCPYEIIVYSVLKHINTARMHTISRQFIPLIYRSLGKRIVSLKSNLFCPFTNVNSCPLVILPVFILKNTLGSIFS